MTSYIYANLTPEEKQIKREKWNSFFRFANIICRFSSLNDYEVQLLFWRFFGKATFREIHELTDKQVSRQRIEQQLKDILQKIKREANIHGETEELKKVLSECC